MCAPRNTLLTACALEQGQSCSERESLQLAKEGSELLVQFSRPSEQAEKVPQDRRSLLLRERPARRLRFAAVEGSIGNGVIVPSTRAVSPGASVKLEEGGG